MGVGGNGNKQVGMGKKGCVVSHSAKGVDLTGLLGGHKRVLEVSETKVPSRVQGRSPGRSPPEAEAFL